VVLLEVIVPCCLTAVRIKVERNKIDFLKFQEEVAKAVALQLEYLSHRCKDHNALRSALKEELYISSNAVKESLASAYEALSYKSGVFLYLDEIKEKQENDPFKWISTSEGFETFCLDLLNSDGKMKKVTMQHRKKISPADVDEELKLLRKSQDYWKSRCTELEKKVPQHSEEKNSNSKFLDLLVPGTTVIVQWNDTIKYYLGTIQELRPAKKFKIDFHEGTAAVVDAEVIMAVFSKQFAVKKEGEVVIFTNKLTRQILLSK
jgi:hypothetical protein